MTAIFKLRPLKFIIKKSQDKHPRKKILYVWKKMKSVSYFFFFSNARKKTRQLSPWISTTVRFFFQTGLSTVRALYPKGAKQRPNDCLDTTNYKQK